MSHTPHHHNRPSRRSTCSVHVEKNLDELRWRRDLESLRPNIKSEQCFLPAVDPNTAPITMEEVITKY